VLWDLTTGDDPFLATADADTIEAPDVNSIVVTFSGAPALNQYRVVVVASGDGGITVEQLGETPIEHVRYVVVDGGTVADDGDGQVTITVAASASGETPASNVYAYTTFR
jgi:hypothetical protein